MPSGRNSASRPCPACFWLRRDTADFRSCRAFPDRSATTMRMANLRCCCVPFGLLLLATPGVLNTVEFETTLTMTVGLIAVAVREV